MADSTPVKRLLYRIAFHVGRRYVRATRQGNPSLALRAARFVTYWSVFEPLKRRIGFDRTRLAISGAAPASPELFDFFQALGGPLIAGYGMTESSGVITVNRFDQPRAGP